ncbi:MAG: ATP phosphoribosyltransferase regulatory subunit, partial [Alphaproteobacteria bacterium]|nr:ATP phosphoribosyltransferase regulatory subunit [Alphaproteobacteria bacterium]
MAGAAAARAAGQRLMEALRAAGAEPVEARILQPAGTLLDLYGEEMRARAYVTADPVQGEMMLRPDFTVPVVQMHMAEGAEPARYCYLGEVFRKQDGPATRPSEYLQVGYEVFARDDPAAADAEVFALIAGLLAPLGLRAVTGDMGLLGAAVAGLTLRPARKAALTRHIWRPARFRALIDRFAGRAPVPPARADLIARLRAEGAGAMIRAAGPLVGLRTEAEIEARAAALLADADAPPLPEAEAARIDALLAVAGPAPEA